MKTGIQTTIYIVLLMLLLSSCGFYGGGVQAPIPLDGLIEADYHSVAGGADYIINGVEYCVYKEAKQTAGKSDTKDKKMVQSVYKTGIDPDEVFAYIVSGYRGNVIYFATVRGLDEKEWIVSFVLDSSSIDPDDPDYWVDNGIWHAVDLETIPDWLERLP